MGITIMGNERGQIGFIAPLLITELGVGYVGRNLRGTKTGRHHVGTALLELPVDTGLFSPNTYFHNFISYMHRGLLDCTTPPRVTELGTLDFILGQWEIRTCNKTSSMNGDFHLKGVLWFFLSIFLFPQNNEVELPPSPTSDNRCQIP